MASTPRGRKAESRAGKPGLRRAEGGAEVAEEAPESAGMGLETGMAILTALLLIAAWVLVDKELGRYGHGLFFTQ